MKKDKILVFLFLPILLLHISPLQAWVTPTASEIALDNSIAELTGLMRFSELINPVPDSATREKRHFFEATKAGRSYEPEFSYDPLPESATSAALNLRKIPSPSGVYRVYLEEARKQLLDKFDILSARGKKEFSRLARELYSLPSPQEVKQAEDFIKRYGVISSPKDKLLTDKDMAAELSKALQERGLIAWKVRISAKMSASASVLPGSRTIKIRRGVRFDRDDVVRLVHHEIGVHAQRAENGHAMPLKVFRVGLEGYLETEEGMAANNEERHEIREGLQLFALRVLTVDWASRLPFSKVFRNLCLLGVDEERAWNLTQRVKRGMTATVSPGCYPKDVSYFRGYLLVKDFLARGGKWEDLMRFGKVSIAHVPGLLKLEKQLAE